MKTEIFTYSDTDKQWSVETFPQLDSPQTLILIFGATQFFDSHDAIQELIKAYPQSQIMGCSTSGEIHNRNVMDNSLSVAVTRFDNTILKSIGMPVPSNEDIKSVTQTIANALLTPDLRGVFVLGSGLNLNFAMIVRQLQEKLGNKTIITGGVSGDGDKFQRTWVLHEGKPQENMLTVVGFYGDAINITFGSKGGWQPNGVPLLITRAKDNILYKLNGRSALNWYKFQLRKYKAELPAGALFFPLAVRRSLNNPDYVVRTILAIDEENEGMTFAGEMSERYFAQFMTASNEQLIAGAQEAARLIPTPETIDNPPLVVAVSCVGRRLVMDDKTSQELEAVLDILPEGTQQIGFYSYGEICPIAENGYSELHNQTMTLTMFSESKS